MMARSMNVPNLAKRNRVGRRRINLSPLINLQTRIGAEMMYWSVYRQHRVDWVQTLRKVGLTPRLRRRRTEERVGRHSRRRGTRGREQGHWRLMVVSRQSSLSSGPAVHPKSAALLTRKTSSEVEVSEVPKARHGVRVYGNDERYSK